MTMPETLKPDELVARLFYRVNNPSAWSEGFDQEGSDLISEAAGRILALQSDLERVRGIISECAAAIGNVAVVSPSCSLDFMALVPNEIRMATLAVQTELREARAERDDWKSLAMSAPQNAVVKATWEVLGGQDATREGGQSLVGRVTELRDRALTAEAALVKARTALENIRELNMTNADENGHRWSNSDLIDQEIVFALPAGEEENGR